MRNEKEMIDILHKKINELEVDLEEAEKYILKKEEDFHTCNQILCVLLFRLGSHARISHEEFHTERLLLIRRMGSFIDVKLIEEDENPKIH